MRALCLDHLSLSDLTAIELIDIAAKLECGAVSLFVTPLPLGPYRDLVHDPIAKAEVLRALRDTGLAVGIVEPFMLDDRIDWDVLHRTAAVTAELGGTINTLCFDTDRLRLEQSLRRLARIARAEGTKLLIEGFTLSSVRTAADALSLADAAGVDAGLTIDSLHVVRTGGSWDEIASLPANRIAHVQLSDGRREPPIDLFREATLERMPPGLGEFDLAGLIKSIPETARIAVEAPFRAPPDATPIERGRTIVEASRRLLLDSQV